MNRAWFFRLACAAALFASLAARAGDPQAHTAAMTQAAQQVALDPAFQTGVGAPQQNGVPQTGQFPIPTIGNVACNYDDTVSYDDGSCPYIGLNGQAINAPDDWACIDMRMPPALNSINSMLPPGQVLFANSLVAVGESEAAMVCNFNHFNSNPVGPAGGDSASAAAITLAWANTIPDSIAANGGLPNSDPNQAIQCTPNTWNRYYARIANSLHYTQDSVCEDHKNGNISCGADDAVSAFGTSFSFAGYARCQAFLASTLTAISVGDGTSACDESVVNNASAPAALNGKMTLVYGMCQGGLSLSCMGLERTIRHHCSLPGTPKTLVCLGPPDDHMHSLDNRQFCEGEVYSNNGGEPFLDNATAASVPVLKAAAQKWASVCKEPDDPCVPAQCDAWCQRKFSATVDDGSGQVPFGGFCVNATPDSNCVLHTCQCSIKSLCGTVGKPCCTSGADCTDSSLECGESTGTCVAKGSDSCQNLKATISPASQQLTMGLSSTLTAALFVGNLQVGTTGYGFRWTNTGNAGTLQDTSGPVTNQSCIASSQLTYVPNPSQTAGTVDTITVDIYPSSNCSPPSDATGLATITIAEVNPTSVWRLKNISASGSDPVPPGETTYPTEQGVSSRFQSDLAAFQGANGGTTDARLYFNANSGVSIDFVPSSNPPGTTDNGIYSLATSTMPDNIFVYPVDDSSFDWAYSFSGTAPANGTVTGTLAAPAGNVCLGQSSVVNYPSLKFEPDFVMDGATASGTLVYTYRVVVDDVVVQNQCPMPGTTYYEWTMSVSFDADRIQ